MGETPSYSFLDNFPGPRSYPVVAPFAATTRGGSVTYTHFTTSENTQRSRVSTFIRSETGDGFYGTRMMVAGWDGVSELWESTVSCKVHVPTYCSGVGR